MLVLLGHGFFLPNRFGRGYSVFDGLLQHGVLWGLAGLLGCHHHSKKKVELHLEL
jgi:light-regulated signal transduction histidine kinase (bacteriophytochrome)